MTYDKMSYNQWAMYMYTYFGIDSNIQKPYLAILYSAEQLGSLLCGSIFPVLPWFCALSCLAPPNIAVEKQIALFQTQNALESPHLQKGTFLLSYMIWQHMRNVFKKHGLL